MNPSEFAAVMRYISAGCGWKIDADRVEVYYDLLKDVPLPVLQLAAKTVLLTRSWNSFPQAGEIRQAVASVARSHEGAMTATEAWGWAQKAIRRIDFAIQGSVERAMADIPEIVRRAMREYGIGPLMRAKEEVAHAQFCRTFEAIQQGARRQLLIPEQMAKDMQALAAPVAKVVGQIGVEKDEQPKKKGRGK